MRRVGSRHRRVVPGLSRAWALYARRFAQSWPTPGTIQRAEAAEQGQPVTLDGATVWSVLFRARSPQAAHFEHDDGQYVLTAPDVLELVADPRGT